MPLTALGVKNAKPQDKPYKLSDEKGLYLLITPSGSKLWRFDYRFADKRKTLAFGKWYDVELAQARDRRDEARKSLAAGRDPAIGDVQEEVVVKNRFEAVARDWHAAAKTAWTPRYAKMVLGRLEADIFPHLGNDDIDTIEPPRLLEVIRKIEARDALEMAKRVKNYCSEIFQYGIAEGKGRRDPAAEIHRALKKPRPKKHMSAVSPAEFPKLVTRMHAYDGDELTRLALVFTLITMVRTQETRFAAIDEFENLDGQEPLWRLSPERMKMSREHLVPLPHQAVTIVKRLREKSPDSRYLFPASTKTGVISENTMLYGLYRMGYHSRQTTHGLRRCASTILNESGKFEPDWIETQLAHADDDKVRGAYNAAIYLPHDYTGLPHAAPRLGPPLPGDLGKPMLNAGVAPPGMPTAGAMTPEQQRVLQERDAARISHLFATTNAAPSVPSAAPTPSAGATSPTPAGASDSSGDHKLAFLNAATDRQTQSPDRLADLPSPHVILAGSIIPAALVTGLRSDLPGEIVAQVTQNVFDTPTGKILLIPQGAKLVGQYDAQITFGQSRALLVWTRLILPNGKSIILERQPATDTEGYAGLEDEVDNHWGMLFEAAILSTVLSVGSEAGTSDSENNLAQAIRQGASQSFNQTGEQVVGRSLNVQPTITIRPGFPVNVLVTHDLILEAYRA